MGSSDPSGTTQPDRIGAIVGLIDTQLLLHGEGCQAHLPADERLALRDARRHQSLLDAVCLDRPQPRSTGGDLVDGSTGPLRPLECGREVVELLRAVDGLGHAAASLVTSAWSRVR